MTIIEQRLSYCLFCMKEHELSIVEEDEDMLNENDLQMKNIYKV